MINDVLTKLTGIKVYDPYSIILSGFSSGRNFGSPNMLIKADNIYSISQGLIIDIGKNLDGTYIVTVQYGADTWIRYGNLLSVDCEEVQSLSPGDPIGITYNHSVSLEYCTLSPSKYPVRLQDTIYYKHDPITLLYMEGSIFSIPQSTTDLDEFFAGLEQHYQVQE